MPCAVFIFFGIGAGAVNMKIYINEEIYGNNSFCEILLFTSYFFAFKVHAKPIQSGAILGI